MFLLDVDVRCRHLDLLCKISGEAFLTEPGPFTDVIASAEQARQARTSEPAQREAVAPVAATALQH